MFKKIKKNISNIPGWRTKRHIIVFESDDWGTIRTSNIAAVNRLVAKGIDFMTLDAERYSYNDSLASIEDLTALFNVLMSVKDSNNSSAVFTALSLVANPDFHAIKESGFKKYYYEPITTTMSKTKGCEGAFELWQKGINEGVFIPQSHGREHLNVVNWMYALRNGHKETIDVFDEGMWGYVNSFYEGRRINYQEAFNIYDPAEVAELEEIITDGLKLFEKLFKYQARLFVPPNGLYSTKIEDVLAKNGIKFISASKIQNNPKGYGKLKKVFHYLGMKNRFGQIYLTRNAFFEPGSNIKTDWVDSCLNDVNMAFKWNKPAIISTHRVNYIGRFNRKNRENGLVQLERLLMKIKDKWPDVEFMSSDKLGSLIIKDKG